MVFLSLDDEKKQSMDPKIKIEKKLMIIMIKRAKSNICKLRGRRSNDMQINGVIINTEK